MKDRAVLMLAQAGKRNYNIVIMKLKLVHIGNSRGIRLPKAVIEQCGLSGDIDLEVSEGQVILRPARRPRTGWAEAFRKAGPSPLLDPETPTEFDHTEWTW
jgi:antitoxin MazE